MGMDPEQLVRAGRTVREKATERGLSITQLARNAHVDPKTVRALVNGDRWPTARTMTAIEEALGWCAGEVARRSHDGVESLAGFTDRVLLHELLDRAEKRGDEDDCRQLRALLARARARDPCNDLRRAQ